MAFVIYRKCYRLYALYRLIFWYFKDKGLHAVIYLNVLFAVDLQQ